MARGALSKHNTRIAFVAQGLQGQAMGVVEAIDSAVDASEQRRMVDDRARFRMPAVTHRATVGHCACGYPWEISYSIWHFALLYGQRSHADTIMR